MPQPTPFSSTSETDEDTVAIPKSQDVNMHSRETVEQELIQYINLLTNRFDTFKSHPIEGTTILVKINTLLLNLSERFMISMSRFRSFVWKICLYGQGIAL